MRFRGTLEPESARGGGGLPVVLDISDRRVVVTTGDDTLGTYPISEVHVERRGSDRFDFQVGGELLTFTADDALRFSYEAMPMLTAPGVDSSSQVLTRVKSWWRDRTESVRDEVEEAGDFDEDDQALSFLDEPDPPPEKVNPDFKPASGGPSLSDLRRRFGTERLTDLHEENGAGEAPPTDTGVASFAFDTIGTEERVEDPPVQPPPIEPPPLFRPPPETAPVEEPSVAPIAAWASAPPSVVTEDIAKPAPSSSLAAVTCAGLRSDGTRCGSAVVSERGFCFAHDPDRADERRRVEKETTAAARRVRRNGQDLSEVLARLERAVIDVHEGRIQPEQAMAMASLAQAMVDTMNIARAEKPSGS